MSSGHFDGGEAVGEREPDYRFTLANERTFLAWLRTALALDAAGIAVVHLLPQLLVPGVRELAGVSLVFSALSSPAVRTRAGSATSRHCAMGGRFRRADCPPSSCSS